MPKGSSRAYLQHANQTAWRLAEAHFSKRRRNPKSSTPPPPPSPPAPAARAGSSSPFGPVESSDPRAIGWERLIAQAKAKDIKIANRLTGLKLTPEQVLAMPEDVLNVHIKAAGYEPFRGKNLSRQFSAGRLDIVNAMRAMKAAATGIPK